MWRSGLVLTEVGTPQRATSGGRGQEPDLRRTGRERPDQRPDLGLEEVGVVARVPDLKRSLVQWLDHVVLCPTRSDLATPGRARPGRGQACAVAESIYIRKTD